MAEPAHVALITSPGLGHLIPMAEFAKQLVLRHNLKATLMVFPFFMEAQKPLIDTFPPGLSTITLPTVSTDDLPPDLRIEARVQITIARTVPSVRDILADLKSTTRLAAFIIDGFCVETLPAARELGIPDYLLFTCPFMVLAMTFHLPTLAETTTCQLRDLPEPVTYPGCVPVKGGDLLDTLQDRNHPIFAWFVQLAHLFLGLKGCLVNSFIELEPKCAKALLDGIGGTAPPSYPVGPLLGQAAPSEAPCLKWLDEQPAGSVLFVAFGSGGTLSTEQQTELALGLELSGQRFLWAVRCPSDTDTSATFFGVEGAPDPLAFLPEGFLERTKGQGMVVPVWAPQFHVLNNAATGGFLTHCGWNSSLESMACGVPMIVWPLYAEQRMNAVLLVDDAKVALRPEDGADGIVRKEEIARVVKDLMEGEGGKGAREKVKELQKASAKALTEEGSSHKALVEVVDGWKEAVAAA